MTPREFTIEMSAQVERQYDDMETRAYEAIMNRIAQNEKRVRMSDLFKRPTGEINTDRTAEDVEKEQADKIAWLSQFEEFSGKFSD